MSSQTQNQVLMPRNAFGHSETIDSRLWCIHTRDKSWKCIKRVQEHIFNHFYMFLILITCVHALSLTFNHFWGPNCILECWKHLFLSLTTHIPLTSIYFYQILSVFIYFYLLPIDFIYFRTSLLVLDCFYLFFYYHFGFFLFFFFTIHFLLHTPGYALRQGRVDPRSGQCFWLGPWPYAGRARPRKIWPDPGPFRVGSGQPSGQPGLALPVDSVGPVQDSDICLNQTIGPLPGSQKSSKNQTKPDFGNTSGKWQWYSAYTPNSWKIISNAQILSLCNNSYTYQCEISIVIQWFHLKMGGNWQWYSTFTLNSWKIICSTQIPSNFAPIDRFLIVIQQFQFYLKRVETDNDIIRTLWLVGKSSDLPHLERKHDHNKGALALEKKTWGWFFF